MLINETTGEIAYHVFLLKKEGGLEFKQYDLKNNVGKIKLIESLACITR